MGPAAEHTLSGAPHIPVLMDEVLEAAAPLQGASVIDGTFGAGGYSRALLSAGTARLIGIDRDTSALAMADWAQDDARVELVEGRFGDLDDYTDAPVDVVVLDIGVSSMQLDQAERGFSFLRDGPLDMRMSGEGTSAADLVNHADEATLADIFYQYGEERASRRIARAVVAARKEAVISGTLQLAEIVARCLPRPKPGQAHPATRCFQALRIAVNDELGELARGLAAAERILKPGGRLVVVTFHSLEDRIVKRYLQLASAETAGGSRHAPAQDMPPARFKQPRKPVSAGQDEVGRNPRARSARLRSAVRTEAAPVKLEPRALGMPSLALAGKPNGANR